MVGTQEFTAVDLNMRIGAFDLYRAVAEVGVIGIVAVLFGADAVEGTAVDDG